MLDTFPQLARQVILVAYCRLDDRDRLAGRSPANVSGWLCQCRQRQRVATHHFQRWWVAGCPTIADRANLLRDMRVYGAVVWRLANAPVLPLDLAAAGADLRASLARYQQHLGHRFDLGPALAAADAFSATATAVLAAAARALLASAPADDGVALTSLPRARNRVVWGLREASRALRPEE
jgi:hypothetical protein